jgi:hypothetical protein
MTIKRHFCRFTVEPATRASALPATLTVSSSRPMRNCQSPVSRDPHSKALHRGQPRTFRPSISVCISCGIRGLCPNDGIAVLSFRRSDAG